MYMQPRLGAVIDRWGWVPYGGTDPREPDRRIEGLLPEETMEVPAGGFAHGLRKGESERFSGELSFSERERITRCLGSRKGELYGEAEPWLEENEVCSC